MADFIAHVTWDNIKNYRKELKKDLNLDWSKINLPLTNQYASSQPIVKKMKYSDRLWLFTSPVFGTGVKKRILPPSVLGRLYITHKWDVGEDKMSPAINAPDGTPHNPGLVRYNVSLYRSDSSKKYHYWRAGNPDRALPIHNAFSLLKGLTFNGSVKKIDPKCKNCNLRETPPSGPYGHLLQHFQSIRSLTDRSAESLNELYNFVPERRVLFLSHRHEKKTIKLVEEVVKRLKDHALCWWDKKELPQLPEYENLVLQDIFDDGIRQAGWFIPFVTSDYGSTKWTEIEWKTAKRHNTNPQLTRKPRILPVMLGGEFMKDMKRFPSINSGWNPKAIADAIIEKLQIQDLEI